MPEFNLDDAIRKVPDFPKPGILFYDITSVFTNSEAFRYCLDALEKKARELKIDAIAAVEARGFLFGAPIASETGLPMVLVRKKGKLPGDTIQRSFALEYGEDTIEIHKADVKAGQRIFLIDDLIATGGTLKAAKELLEEAGAEVIAVGGVIGLPFLGYHDVLGDTPVHTLINYDSE